MLRAEQSRAEQSRAEQSRAEQSKVITTFFQDTLKTSSNLTAFLRGEVYE